MAKGKCDDLLFGMKEICAYVGKSEATILKYQRELALPIKKGSKNGDTGIWIGSKEKIDEWSRKLHAA
jgi:predicted DNA-binding transcriptional regulator AlpA